MALNPLTSALREGLRAGGIIGEFIALVVRVVAALFGRAISSRDSYAARERKETMELQDEARQAYEASPFGKTERITFVVELVLEASNRAGRVRAPLPFLYACCDATEALMADEGMFPIEIDWERVQSSIEAGIDVRTYLRAQKHFFSRYERHMDIWREKLIRIFEGVLQYLPENVAHDDDGAESTTTLRAAFVDLLDDPPDVIERLLVTLNDRDVTDAKLFTVTRERFDRNALFASGISAEDRHRTTRSFVLPSAMRGKSPADLVELYLRGTPFAPFFQHQVPIAIPLSARFEHCHIVGGTGHGKTQLLQFLIHRDLIEATRDGRSLIVIDSHGDLIDTLAHLGYWNPQAKKSLADRFVLIDPTDIEYPVALNLFDVSRTRSERADPLEREKLLHSTIELYEYIFGALLGAELTQKQGVIFKYLARLLLEIPDATVQTLRELMEDGRPYQPYMARLEGTARSFFEKEFFDRSFVPTKKQIVRRLWGVLANPTFERMFSHPRNKLDLYEAMNGGKIILVNTAKELLGQEGCEIFGRFILALVAQAALQRASIPVDERRPTFVYIDEAHDYFDEHIEGLLNQARKYRVGMVIAHQNLDQLTQKLKATIAASTSVKLAGGVSAKDARAYAEETNCEPEFVQSMHKRSASTEFACWVKNVTPQAIRLSVPLGYVESLPVIDEGQYDALVEVNRARYCTTRAELTQILRPRDSPNVLEELEEPPPVRRRAPPEEFVKQIGAPQAPPPTPEVPRDVVPPEQPAPVQRQRPEHQPKRVRVEPGGGERALPPLGRGGVEHTYLQELIKGAAQERGFHATIEEQILDGAGRVDVSLVRGGTKIACEISITSTPEQEMENVRKCLRAGYGEVIVVASQQRRLHALRKFVAPRLEEGEVDRVRFLLPEATVFHLNELASAMEPKETTVRGYRVKVEHKVVGSADAQDRRRAIAQVIARSMTHMKQER